MNRFLAPAMALALVAGCAKNEKQTVETVQAPSEPAGAIVGFVTSLRTAQPLSGVTVTTVSAGGLRSATTDSNGAYFLGGLTAGASYSVRFAAAGHVPALGVSPLVPNSAGDYPSNGVAQLDVKLAEANSTVTGHVYARDGAPAAGVVLAVDLRSKGFDLGASATRTRRGRTRSAASRARPRGSGSRSWCSPGTRTATGFPTTTP